MLLLVLLFFPFDLSYRFVRLVRIFLLPGPPIPLPRPPPAKRPPPPPQGLAKPSPPPCETLDPLPPPFAGPLRFFKTTLSRSGLRPCDAPLQEGGNGENFPEMAPEFEALTPYGYQDWDVPA